MPFGAMTVSNDLVFDDAFDGTLRAYSIEDGSEVWTSDLGAGTNSPLAIAGDTLVTAAGFHQGGTEGAARRLQAELIYRRDRSPLARTSDRANP